MAINTDIKLKIKYTDKNGKPTSFEYDFENNGAKDFADKLKKIMPVIIKVVGQDLKKLK